MYCEVLFETEDHVHVASPSTSTVSPAAWSGADQVTRNIAIVIDRCRLIGSDDGSVDLRDFEREPETCELDEETIRQHVGKAARLVVAGAVPAPDPTYSRPERIRQGAEALKALLPSRQDIIDRLSLHSFKPDEIESLLPDIMARAATVLNAGVLAQFSAWDLEQLSKNAE